MPTTTYSSPLTDHLISEYAAYRLANAGTDESKIAPFFSPTIHQTCRPLPSFSATTREEILAYLAHHKENLQASSSADAPKVEGKWELRELTDEEKKDIPEEFKEISKKESWEGRRVDLWDEVEGQSEVDKKKVVVNYYWRMEGGRWVQCLHDILWFSNNVGVERLVDGQE